MMKLTDEIREIEKLSAGGKLVVNGRQGAIEHERIFTSLISQIEEVDFRELAQIEGDIKLTNAHYRIITIEQILKLAERNNWGLCRNQDFIYAYNGCYWSLIDKGKMATFLGKAAEKMGVPWEKARDYNFKDGLYKQFLSSAHLEVKKQKAKILIPLLNGTFEIGEGDTQLRGFDRQDFLTYQLPFEYDAQATCPMFIPFLKEVLPDVSSQQVLAEFLGWVFVRGLKLEKALILYGSGANGKSTMFDIVSALFGANNVSNYSLSNLTQGAGYHRAMIANKLVNYSPEINGSLEAATFKQLVSGEPVEARLPYGNPMILHDYAKLIFNTNTLPHDVEHTHAFFRRFLIIPFTVSIPEEKQDPELAKKIISSELAGVFNWVLAGLDRILSQRKFTRCEAAKSELEKFRKESDSVALFLEEEGYEKSIEGSVAFKELYVEYRTYCATDGYRSVSRRTFGDRLRLVGYDTVRKNYGLVVCAQKKVSINRSLHSLHTPG
jgi:putative DNA primase/helicase